MYLIGHKFTIKEIMKADIKTSGMSVTSTYRNVPAVVEGAFRNGEEIRYWVNVEEVGTIVVGEKYISMSEQCN